jgi:hypothetical protein
MAKKNPQSFRAFATAVSKSRAALARSLGGIGGLRLVSIPDSVGDRLQQDKADPSCRDWNPPAHERRSSLTIRVDTLTDKGRIGFAFLADLLSWKNSLSLPGQVEGSQ